MAESWWEPNVPQLHGLRDIILLVTDQCHVTNFSATCFPFCLSRELYCENASAFRCWHEVYPWLRCAGQGSLGLPYCEYTMFLPCIVAPACQR